MAAIAFLTIPGLVLGLLAFALIDRLGLWANRRWKLPWMRDPSGRAVSAVAVETLEVFYSPTKHHELKERRHSLIKKETERDGAPPHRVDLDRGTAVIRRTPVE
ncbi:DUF6191 domain-containing protein [Actinomadura macrotermitis]|uniref:DUF6191 domain-containing protein n=1 Tax=Actinomadura macrotermitis TaxID=2585200 RepID=UPI001A9AFF4A|nr:DUF6191 domain-containing protein [Actinomadura macrotermitis]